MGGVPEDYGVRHRVITELNHPGVFNWDEVDEGTPEYRRRMDTAGIEVVRIVQTLAREIDRLAVEVDELRQGRAQRNGMN